MNRYDPRKRRAVLILAALSLGASACVAYPARRDGPYANGPDRWLVQCPLSRRAQSFALLGFAVLAAAPVRTGQASGPLVLRRGLA
jgi:hypothetical protein